jgi:hypothetical protein
MGRQVGVPDYVVGGFGQQPEPVLLPLAFGNVAHDRLDGRFALVGNRGGRGLNVNGLPVEARDLLLHQRHGLSPVGAVEAVLHGFPVIGVGKAENALADQLAGMRGAEQFGGGRVGKHDFAVHVDDRAVEQLHEHPVPFFGLLQRFLRLPDRFVFCRRARLIRSQRRSVGATAPAGAATSRATAAVNAASAVTPLSTPSSQ